MRERKCYVALFHLPVDAEPLQNAELTVIDRTTGRTLYLQAGVVPQDTSDAGVQVNLFDRMEEYHNCAVQVLENSITGDVSVGWWRE